MSTKQRVLAYALIGAASYPVALFAGEAVAALFCVAAMVAFGVHR